MPTVDVIVLLILFTGMALSVVTKKLTISAAITGGTVGFLIYKGSGVTGICVLALFFVLGSCATGWQRQRKKSSFLAEGDEGKRTAGQVLANGGVAAMLGMVGWNWPHQVLLISFLIAGSFASATADTLSSELGTVYGSRFYDVLTFKKAAPGDNGVISLEGTLIGVVGALVIALVYSVGFGFGFYSVVIVAAGATGNLADSFLGAVLERRNLISNNAVNFLNTATGAAVCLLAYLLTRK